SDTAKVNEYLRSDAVTSALPPDLKLAWSAKPIGNEDGTSNLLSLYALKVPRGGEPKLDGSTIVNASQDFDIRGDVEVSMTMNAEGAQIWKVMTGDNVGQAIAIV